jgi:hypothetical protein
LPKHGSEARAGAPFSKKPPEQSVPRAFLYIFFIYYIAFIFQKNMQNAKLIANYMKTCIFVLLVDEYYIIMKIEMASIVN